ncbi:hypothetical protein E6O75_ATG08091 [Venturia nashicola]|uniref:Autophagy-related protein 14 n=1 Tax=Venturia nashicola TaxID=86259 RepID=A0A4Z1P018_9PEZI|nr:hypothetical protein E6O75_ATG08091 [Venturia nashicola]
MECDICGQHKPPFHCHICARSALYPVRHEYAVTLTDKEAMGRRVKAVVKAAENDAPRESLSLSGAIIDTHDCAKAHELSDIKSESAALSERIRLVSERAEALNLEMHEHKKSILSKKATLSQRRSDAESATYGREGREKKELETVEGSIKRMKRRWEMKHEDIVVGRSSLCREAARLAGLKRTKRAREDGVIREFYTIGTGLNIFDLRELHTAKPEELTASLTQLAYLTVRVSTYLALRLPAEIILPHRDYPLATIFNPPSSYTSHDLQFPSAGSGPSSTGSPAISRTADHRTMHRPRPLYVQSPLAKFSRDDPPGFSMFVEGVTLLAWDIAWLCRTQGMGGLNSEVDICSLGRNLWNLLLDETKVSVPQTESTVPEGRELGPNATSSEPPSHVPALFGQFSHGTAHSFFGYQNGKEIMQNWKLQNPARSLDKIKEYLRAEIQRAEWEVVDGVEWEVDGADEQAVLVGGRQYYDKGGKAVQSEPVSEKAGRPEGTKLDRAENQSSVGPSPLARPGAAVGWTKLRKNSIVESSQKSSKQ